MFARKVPDEKKANNSVKYKQLSLLDLFAEYGDSYIVENSIAQEEKIQYVKTHAEIDSSKNVLVSLVKTDNFEHFEDQTAKIYYTGKRFPATVALNKLYYFMPYLKGKGIRDLYLIKVARVGTRKEGQPDNDPNDFRLVFELEFVQEVFDDYKPISLEIWRTFTDTNLMDIFTRLNNKS